MTCKWCMEKHDEPPTWEEMCDECKSAAIDSLSPEEYRKLVSEEG